MMRLIDVDMIDTTYSDPEVIETLDNVPTVKAIPIPEGATNGDIIKALFPDIIFDDLSSNYVTVENMDGNNNKTFIKDWWNAPYKE